MRLSAARATVVAFLFVTPTAAADVPGFTLGHVDLLDLAANAPLGTVPAARPPAPAPPATLRELHVVVESFLRDDVKSTRQGARWRLDAARRGTAVDTGTNSYDGNPLGALIAVVLGSVSYSMDTGLRRARACSEYLEGLENRTRALLEAVPETDEPATPELLARWERLRTDLRSNGICPARRWP